MKSKHFEVVKHKRGHSLRALNPHNHPRSVRLHPSDVKYLRSLNRKGRLNTFDMAAVFDFGCGVFAKNS